MQGPVAVLLTTTAPSLDEETASRFLTLTIDESREMTETILATQRHRDTLVGYLAELDRAAVIAKHQAAQRLLEPLVVINLCRTTHLSGALPAGAPRPQEVSDADQGRRFLASEAAHG